MRVAIVGAGFSGLLAAFLLEKKGFHVTVYEKEYEIGGHCSTLQSKGIYFDLGTVFAFPGNLKELLIELGIEYSERFTYRNFVDADYCNVEHMCGDSVGLLMRELETLKKHLIAYDKELSDPEYGEVPLPLKVPLSIYLKNHNLQTISEVIAPHLSSYGFGSIDELEAYYAFKVFNMNTIDAFIRGSKLLFVNKGMRSLVDNLAERISDIRYGHEVVQITPCERQVVVESPFGTEVFDKVIVTTKLDKMTIADPIWQNFMGAVKTNAFFTSAFEVENKNLVTTYFKAHLGQKEKVQFFHTFRQNKTNLLVSYTYGKASKELVADIEMDLKKSGIHINRLITVKQWNVFPHIDFKQNDINLYKKIREHQAKTNIYLAGAIITKPSISHLYNSVHKIVNAL